MTARPIFYYPIKLILSTWLPQYADSLRYMALLFPICIYESKMSNRRINKKLIHKVMKRDDAENRIILTLSLFLESNSLIVQSSLNHLCVQQNKLKFLHVYLRQ